MLLRPALLSLLLATSALFVVPAVQADDPVPPVCASSAAPALLSPGIAILGNDGSAGSGAASDCYFSFALPDGVEGSSGKELQIAITSTENHDVWVARNPAQALTGPYACQSVATAASSESCRVYWPLTQPVYTVRVGRAGAGSGDFSLTVSVDAAPASGCPNGYAIVPLTEAVASTVSLGAAAGSRCYFKLLPNAGADLAKFVATGLPSLLGSYLIVKEGDVPLSTAMSATSGSDSICAPLTGTTRTCTPDIPVAGKAWYAVLVRGTAVAAATNVGLTGIGVSSCSLGRGYHIIGDAETISSATVGPDAGSKCDFLLMPSQVESLDRFTLTPGAANTDLYVFKQSSLAPQPIPRTGFVCSSVATAVATPDVCAAGKDGVSGILATVYRPAAGASATGFSLKAEKVEGCSLGSAVTELVDNVAVPVALTNDNDAFCAFHFVPNPLEATVRVSDVITSAALPAGAAVQTISETMYVKRGSPASPSSFDCSAVASISTATSASGGAVTVSNGLCDLQNLGDEIHVLVRRTSLNPASIVTARAFSPCTFDDASPGGSTHPLAAGVAVTGTLLDDAAGACQLRFDVPDSADAASVVLTSDPGADFDLYLKRGSAPTPSSYDCRSNSNVTGAVESCLSVLGAGSYYATVRRSAGSGAWSVVATAVSSCSLGTSPASLAKGVVATGSLLDAVGSKCYFAITPGNPLANPASPGDDIVKLSLTQGSSENFDLYVRKGAVPSTATKDCQSIAAAGSPDVCELVVADGSAYYAMVRRVSGSGPFSLVATSSHSCALGKGYHGLVNGQELQSSTRAVAGVTKCYFTLPSLARDDLLSIVQEAKTANTGYSLTIARDHPVGAGGNDCTASSSWISLPSLGLNLNTLAQCDVLLEDGLPHTWHIAVSRTATAGAADIAFALKGTAQTIPTLVAGVPQVGHVDTGGVQYWKVVLPEGATFLDVQTAGDVSNLACAMGSQAHSLVGTACLLLPFPKLVGCALAAGYGVSCDQAELTLEQRCIEQTGDAATCAEIDAARIEACRNVNKLEPGLCLPPDSNGSVSGTCGIINRRTGDATCDPLGTTVKLTEMDLLVRHRLGLPKSTAYDCRSAEAGVAERCLFSADVQAVHDNVTDPVRENASAALDGLLGSVDGNRTLLDQALADLQQAIADNRTTLLEPLWALVRELVFGLLGQDLGDLPATPAVPAAPNTPGSTLPDPLRAQPLPGAGKYFIAVRGPLDLASSLYYQGGDYAIVALHDGVEVPDLQSADDQLASLIGQLDASVAERCQVRSELPAVCATAIGVVRGLCASAHLGATCSHLGGDFDDVCWAGAHIAHVHCPALPTLQGLRDQACAAAGVGAEPCSHVDGTPAGLCWLVGQVGGPACPALPGEGGGDGSGESPLGLPCLLPEGSPIDACSALPPLAPPSGGSAVGGPAALLRALGLQ